MLWIVIFGVLTVLAIVAIVVANICWERDFSDWLMPVSICLLVLAALFFIGFGGMRIGEKHNCHIFEETKTMMVEVTNNAETLENIGLTNSVIEYNAWLAKAKAGVKNYGAWSIYYGLGVEDMEYISLGDS